MPMSLRQIGRIIDEAFPDLDNMYERMDIFELRNEATAVDYDFGLWWDYVRTTRELANEMGLSMRTLDRALWAYSKAKQ